MKSFQQIVKSLLFFQFIANLEQSESQIPQVLSENTDYFFILQKLKTY